MRTIFIYLFTLLFSYGLHAQDQTFGRQEIVTPSIDIHEATRQGDIQTVREFITEVDLGINEVG